MGANIQHLSPVAERWPGFSFLEPRKMSPAPVRATPNGEHLDRMAVAETRLDIVRIEADIRDLRKGVGWSKAVMALMASTSNRRWVKSMGAETPPQRNRLARSRPAK